MESGSPNPESAESRENSRRFHGAHKLEQEGGTANGSYEWAGWRFHSTVASSGHRMTKLTDEGLCAGRNFRFDSRRPDRSMRTGSSPRRTRVYPDPPVSGHPVMKEAVQPWMKHIANERR